MTKTRTVIADRSASETDKGKDALIIAGEIADLRFHGKPLTLRASKLLHLLVRAAGSQACDRMTHSVSLNDLNETFHLSVAEFIETARELASTAVQLRYVNTRGREAIKIGPMLSDIEREVDEGTEPAIVSWEFSPVTRVLLSTSDHWAALSRQAVLAFESRYALRLYEIISLRGRLQFKRKERFELDDLRKRLGVEEGKLAAFGSFKQRALDPAVAEVNHLSGLEVRYEVVKKGRKVIAIDLSWQQIDKAGRTAQVEELNRGRLGRGARRDGTVETIAGADAAPVVVEFPAFGTIRGTPFEQIARAALPQPMRDLDAIQREFVTWARTGGKPLRGAQVIEMFAGFCRSQDAAS